MSALHTRLDAFLRVVELDEQAATSAHAASLRDLFTARARVEELRAELQRDRRARGRIEEFMVIELERQRLVEGLRAAEALIAKAEKLEQEKRQELSVAHRKAESIRRAIERLRGEQIREINRKEVRELDEIAISRHQRAATG